MRRLAIVAVLLAAACSGEGSSSGGTDKPHLMPDVVCMNLQEAQNTIQKAGVFLSRSHDATGQARHQILDRDWQVVAQQPAAGAEFGENDAVLEVVKPGEQPNPCP